MNFSSLIADIATLIGLNCDFPIMTDFPHSDAEQSSIYSVIGIQSVNCHSDIKAYSNNCVPCDIQIKISLFAPPDTDTHNLFEKFENIILSTLVCSNINITEISGLKTELNKKFNLMEIYSVCNISGLFTTSMEV